MSDKTPFDFANIDFTNIELAASRLHSRVSMARAILNSSTCIFLAYVLFFVTIIHNYPLWGSICFGVPAIFVFFWLIKIFRNGGIAKFGDTPYKKTTFSDMGRYGRRGR